jgi:hypothetical protein
MLSWHIGILDFLISKSCSVMSRSPIHQQQITRSSPSISSILSTVESKDCS